MDKCKKILLTGTLLAGFIFSLLFPVTDEASSRQKFYRFEESLKATGEHSQQDWFQQVQVYDMIALSPDDAARYHVTVNGLWNGFFVDMVSPFAMGRYLESFYSGATYYSDEDFVRAMHDQGLLIPATILTT